MHVKILTFYILFEYTQQIFTFKFFIDVHSIFYKNLTMNLCQVDISTEEASNFASFIKPTVSLEEAIVPHSMEKSNLSTTVQGFDASHETLGVYDKSFKPETSEAMENVTQTATKEFGRYIPIDTGVSLTRKLTFTY